MALFTRSLIENQKKLPDRIKSMLRAAGKQLQWLTATGEMLQMAQEDIPVLKQDYRNIRYIFKNSLYIRASIEGMYLKIAWFLP